MNAKTMAVVLDRLDEKTEAICQLKELLRDTEAATSKLKTLIGCGNLTPAQTEEAIKRMNFERTTLETNHKQHVELVSALASCPLPRDAAESNRAYALRVGDALADANIQWEQDQRRIAQLEKRESELNALHDTIEALPGFPMQPEEKYAEYLQRLAADRAHHADERSRLFTDLEHLKASSAQTLERLRSQLDQNNEQYASERAKNQLLIDQLQNTCSSEELAEALRERDQARRELADEKAGMKTQQSLLCDALTMRDKAQEKAQTAIAEREHFRAKWDASLKARDSAQDEARRTRETNEALQGQLTLRSQIIARVMMDPATNKLFNERDWSDAARKVLIDARGMSIDDGKVQA